MLIVLLIRGLTLPGAGIGIQFYLYPDLGRLADPQVLLFYYKFNVKEHFSFFVVFLPLRRSAGVPRRSAGELRFCWVHLLFPRF